MTQPDHASHIVHAWMNGLNARRLDEVLALYADDAVLLPTFAPLGLRTPVARRGYFERLAARPGLAVTLHDKTLQVQRTAGTMAIASGIYRFQLELDAELLVFEARFSFVIDGALAQPVLHHHSSQIPRTLS